MPAVARSHSVGQSDATGHTNSDPTTPAKGRAGVIKTSCLRCRQLKTKCDGVRPSCSKCTKVQLPCVFPTEVDETRQAAEIRRMNEAIYNTYSERDSYEELIQLLRCVPEEQSIQILRNVRRVSADGGDIFAVLQSSKALVHERAFDVVPVPPMASSFGGHSAMTEIVAAAPICMPLPIQGLVDTGQRVEENTTSDPPRLPTLQNQRYGDDEYQQPNFESTPIPAPSDPPAATLSQSPQLHAHTWPSELHVDTYPRTPAQPSQLYTDTGRFEVHLDMHARQMKCLETWKRLGFKV